MKPALTIEYCPKCGWLLKASYMAQEFLTTFSNELESVILHPSETSGAYKIFIDEQVIFDRKLHGGFLEVKELKQLIRDRIAPGKDLGHSDKKKASAHE